MEHLRRLLEGLEPWQRAVFFTLTGAVALTGVFAAVIASTSDSAPPPPTITTTSLPSTTETSTPSTTAPLSASDQPSTTTTSTTTSTTTTTTAPSPEELLVLRPDGLGEAVFGSSADDVVRYLDDLLGPSSEDTGWVDQAETYGTCLGTEVRFVRWDSLQIFLTDGPSDWAPAGTRHFAAYGHGETVGTPVLDLATAEGVRIGTTVGDLRAIYGNEVVDDDPFIGPYFEVDVPGAGFLLGLLSGTEPADVVLTIGAGESCGE